MFLKLVTKENEVVFINPEKIKGIASYFDGIQIMVYTSNMENAVITYTISHQYFETIRKYLVVNP